VGGYQHGGAFLGQFLKVAAQGDLGVLIQMAEGFIQQQETRTVQHGFGEFQFLEIARRIFPNRTV